VLASTKRIPLIVSVVPLAVIGFVWNWFIPGNWICGFFIEYWLHFALGSCLYFSLCVFTDPRSRWVFVGVVLLLGLASASRLHPWTTHTTADWRSMVELAFLSVVTLSLFLLRPLSPRISRKVIWRPIAALGTISYSLYLIHQFNLTLVASIAQRLLPISAPHFVMVITMVGLHLALATLFWYFCERPFLSKKSAQSPMITMEGGAAARTA
jgi:peptidoglycan/LPS O-acetylase OafA/YrhL